MGLVPVGHFYPADESDEASWQDEENYLSHCDFEGSNVPSDSQPIDSSDDYNSDIIPFAPHEYERIRGSDVDTQTDFSLEECEQAELTDSSIRELTEINERAHLNAENEAEMLRQRSQDALQKKRPKSKDIGYGSESPSNDELERNLVAMDASSDGSEHLVRINQKFTKIINSPSQHFYQMTTVDTDLSTDRNDTDDSADRADRQNRKIMEISSVRHVATNVLSGHEGCLVPQPISDTDGSVSSSFGIHGRNATPVKITSSGSMNQLLKQAGYLIQDEERAMSPKSNKKKEKKVKKSKSKRSVIMNSSGNIVESSCDASGEETSNEEEFSTASDDGEDNMFDSVICLDYTSGSHSGSCDNMAFTSTPMQQRHWTSLATSPISHDAVRIRAGKKRSRDRPWSAIEFYDGKNTIDMKPICTSESAIDLLASSRLGNHNSLSNPSTFPRPRAKARGNFRRTNSVGEQNGKSTDTDSLGAKRRLAYVVNTSAEGTSPSEGFSETAARIVNSGEMIRSDSVKSEQEFLSSRTEDLLQQMENARIKSSDSESESNAGYQTPGEDRSDVDVLNSTGSFSENAWDNYQVHAPGDVHIIMEGCPGKSFITCQIWTTVTVNSGKEFKSTFKPSSEAPLYPTVSEEATEEPLHWEPTDEMEFDEEFKFAGPTTLVKEAIQSKPKQLLKSHQSYDDDSDSDMEDLHHMLEESSDHLQVTERVLKKQRNDPMGTGIYLNPAKYAELLATCSTDMRCLAEVKQQLDMNGTFNEDVSRMQELLNQWEKVEALAKCRQAQSRDLATMFATLQAIKCNIEGSSGPHACSDFTDLAELENYMRACQDQLATLNERLIEMASLRESVLTFMEENPRINMQVFVQNIEEIDTVLAAMLHSSRSRLQELQHLRMPWSEYEEQQKELARLLRDEHNTLQLALYRRELGIDSDEQMQKYLQGLGSDLHEYDDRLRSLVRLRDQFLPSCSSQTKMSIIAATASLQHQLYAVHHQSQDAHKLSAQLSADQSQDAHKLSAQLRADQSRDAHKLSAQLRADQSLDAHKLSAQLRGNQCRDAHKLSAHLKADPSLDAHKISAHLRADQIGDVHKLSAQLTADQIEDVHKLSAQLRAEQKGDIESQKLPPAESRRGVSMLRRILRASSLPMALIVIIGALYLANPELLERILNWSITISPELRYVNGMPPT